MTARIDQIEAYGRAVEEGLVPWDEATADLARLSEGGLTELGAADLIKHWHTARARYNAIWGESRDR
jgi:hypothetical protein